MVTFAAEEAEDHRPSPTQMWGSPTEAHTHESAQASAEVPPVPEASAEIEEVTSARPDDAIAFAAEDAVAALPSPAQMWGEKEGNAEVGASPTEPYKHEGGGSMLAPEKKGRRPGGVGPGVRPGRRGQGGGQGRGVSAGAAQL